MLKRSKFDVCQINVKFLSQILRKIQNFAWMETNKADKSEKHLILTFLKFLRKAKLQKKIMAGKGQRSKGSKVLAGNG